MDIRLKGHGRGIAAAAGLTIAVTCIAVLALTWSNLRQQRSLLDRNMLLTSRVVLRGLETGFTRTMRHMHMSRRNPPPFAELARDILADQVGEGPVRFLAIAAPDGRLVVQAGDLPEGRALPETAVEELGRTGRWYGLIRYRDTRTFLFAAPARGPLAVLCRSQGRDFCPPGAPPLVYLVLGLDSAEYFAAYADFRRAAMLQTGFVLMAAVMLTVLGALMLRRTGHKNKLAYLQRFHSGLLDAMPDGLLTLDAQGRVLAVNPSGADILDADPADLMGRDFSGLDLGELPRDGQEAYWTERQRGGKRLEVLAAPLAGEPGTGRLVLIRDRTAMKELEDRLARSETLAALGRMAAGAAHEIRNPLSAIRGFAQFFAKKLKGAQPEEEYARTMVREADRLNKVITDLLYFARPRDPEPAEVDLEALAGDLVRLVDLEAREKGVALETDIRAPRVVADPDALKQALLNLLVNALDALDALDSRDSPDSPDPRDAPAPTDIGRTPHAPGAPAHGGEGEERRLRGRVSVASRHEDDRVVIEVADTGPGMDPEVARRAMEPFYTTRKSGTGLGLAIVSAIAESHGGELAIDSAPGQGTRMRLCLPLNTGDRRPKT